MARLVPLNSFKPLRNFLTDYAKAMDLFCYLLFVVVFANARCLFVVALWSPVGEGLTSWLFCVRCFLVFLSLSHSVTWVRCGT